MIDVPRLWPKEFDKPDEQPIHAAHDGVALDNIAHPAGLGVVDDVDTQCKAYCDYWAHRLRSPTPKEIT